ncbi:Vegetative incompatibility protein HET-E-1 like [Verticillium longisporum]|nr:Vegetative incompatibility protein HET-E-1 like [Verticillium longisporum]
MHLLDTTTLELKTFIGEIPPYAILSHTWGNDEFLFEHLRAGTMHAQSLNPGRGLQKILVTCKLAREHSLKYAWIDTCCIDKPSSAELSEAINSMYAWCRGSAACYAWPKDVTLEGTAFVGFEESRWFRRGWALQELLAPHGLTFYDKNWTRLASRYDTADVISAMTGIKATYIRREHSVPAIVNFSIMYWASGRTTTRVEDMAYCLLGLFQVNMPLLYGEGRNAFRRLQMNFLDSDPDQSILCWREESTDRNRPCYSPVSFLAPAPSCFRFLPPTYMLSFRHRDGY